jgi:hypothetical protein
LSGHIIGAVLVKVRVDRFLVFSSTYNPEQEVVIDLGVVKQKKTAGTVFDFHKILQSGLKVVSRAREQKIPTVRNHTLHHEVLLQVRAGRRKSFKSFLVPKRECDFLGM